VSFEGWGFIMDGPIKENLKVGAPFWAGRPDIYTTKSGEEKKNKLQL
jgi:hypothetical protein